MEVRVTAALRPDASAGMTLQDVAAMIGAESSAALPGARAHGASYAGDAVERGAVAILTDAAGLAALRSDLPGAVTVPVLVHPAPRSVLGEVAAAVYGKPSERLRVIGV